MPNIAWGPLGYITYKRTYSRPLADGRSEEFVDTVDRIIKACRDQLKCCFTDHEEIRLRDHFYNMRGSVAGRFWWQLGTETVDRLGLFSLQNCAFTVIDDPIKPFVWAMDALMLGSGVGFNLQREHVYALPKVKACVIVRKDTNDADFIVPDSREGWVALLERVLQAHFKTGKGFSYSTVCVRGKGTAIKGFGGVASGPEELCQGMSNIHNLLNSRAKKKLRTVDALDVMNIIGSIVVAGNIRRSAQIALGDMDDLQFLNAKQWSKGDIPNWRAMSNNTVICNDINMLPQQFWDGYAGGGEPYGLLNLHLSRAVGRAGDTSYPDKKVMGSNPCVAGDTEILTDSGYQRIDSLVGTDVRVWNGYEWCNVTPRVTGYDQEMLTVTLSDGRALRCTKAHQWVVKPEGYKLPEYRVSADELALGSKICKYELPIVYGGVSDPNAYAQGFVSGDGMDNYNFLWLYEPKFICETRLNGTGTYKSTYENCNGTKRKVIKFKFSPKAKTYVPFELDVASRLDWFAGLLDADGTELKEGGIQIASVDGQFLRNTQKLLSTLGVQSKITHSQNAGMRALPDGRGGLKEYPCQAAERLLVGAVQMQCLKSLGLQCERMSFNKSPQRDASQFVRVVSIVPSGIEPIVYCFNEPKRHTGCFNGIVTGQCNEQSLEPYETCCLSEIFLPNIASPEQFDDVCQLLYRINKHSLALPCHQPATEKVVHRNMRMGIGVTGYLQATEDQRSWLPDAYKRLREFDVTYSKVHNFPPSIKLTTVKPSGTLSLLAGVTPGCHPAFSSYYIRRIRMASTASLVQSCRDAGYDVEYQRNFDGSNDYNTVVVAFPCAVPEGTILAKDMTAVQQLDVVKRLQSDWSDNAVSCTVYYKKDELPQIREWLTLNYNKYIKGCSFLLHSDHGFDQAPYEEITKQRYDDISNKVKPLGNISAKLQDIELQDCEGGACPIR